MAKSGHEVHVAYLEEGPEDVSFPGVAFHRVPVLGNYDPTLFPKLRRLIRMVKPNIIQSWIILMDVAAGLLSSRRKDMWILREPISGSFYQNRNLKQQLRVRLARKASAVVANSSAGRDYWLAQGVAEQRLFVIQNAVPLESANGVEPMRNESDSGRKLVYAGRLIPRKNIDVLIKAIDRVRSRQEIVLYIAGEGPSKAHLTELVASLELSHVVRFLGFLEKRDLWAHVKAADAFISMSHDEGMPNSVCEAVALGTPVILSNIPVHRAILDDDSALFAAPDSVTETANAILYSLHDTWLAKRRAALALEAVSSWTTEEIASRYLELYAKLLGDRQIR